MKSSNNDSRIAIASTSAASISSTATVLAGTDDADDPFFSPDGQWIGYFARGKLFKISVAGGASVALADVQIDRGGAWGEDDVITFAPAPTPGAA